MRVKRSPGDCDEEALRRERERLDSIFERYYKEIKKRIRFSIRGERHQIDATEFMHDLYVKLAETEGLTYRDTREVFGLLTWKTRNYLVELARRRSAKKRGGEIVFVTLSHAGGKAELPPIDVLHLHAALTKLAKQSALAAEIAQLRLIAGYGDKEIAALLSMSRATVQRYWEMAKICLTDSLASGEIPVEEEVHVD